jgi:uncharacterized protein YtpQ (UPF0354 family)
MMFWKKKKKITDQAIAYIKASNPAPVAGEKVIELPPDATPVVRRYSEDLCICYMVDCGKHYEYVQESHLTAEQIDRDELHRIGLQNLKLVVARRDARVQPYKNIFAFLMGGDFEASVILMDELWDREFRQFVKGDYAAAIPARDILSFCDSNSAEGISELQELIERMQPVGDHLLTKSIYVRRNGDWKPR